MPFQFDTDSFTTAFHTAGYEDVNIEDVVTARRDDDKAWEIVVDRGGRLKATVTASGARPVEKKLTVRDRTALVLIERQTIITLMYTLQDQSELPDVLQALETAVKDRNH